MSDNPCLRTASLHDFDIYSIPCTRAVCRREDGSWEWTFDALKRLYDAEERLRRI